MKNTDPYEVNFRVCCMKVNVLRTEKTYPFATLNGAIRFAKDTFSANRNKAVAIQKQDKYGMWISFYLLYDKDLRDDSTWKNLDNGTHLYRKWLKATTHDDV